MTSSNAGVTAIVSSINWMKYAGLLISIVDTSTGDVAIGILTSLIYNTTNARWSIGLGTQVYEVLGTDTVTVTQPSASSTTIGLGLRLS